MPRNPGRTGSDGPRRHAPATTPQGRENQLVALAEELAEKQLRDGTASAQVISHYLKLGSSREQLEQERLRQENQMLQVKMKAIEDQASMEETYKDALNAMRRYSGHDVVDTENEYDG